MKQLSQRHQEVLDALISDYIASAQPVGSRTISKRLSTRLSPATIRNIMVDLSDMGLLNQPHTSAGRMPTATGLRYYVDTLLHVHDLSEKEQEMIRGRCGGIEEGVQDFLKKASSVMSVISKYVGLVVTPGWEDIVFKQIEFIRLSRGKLLGIFVAQSGLVQNRIIEADEEFTYAELEKINNFCNRVFAGLNLAEARVKIVRELEIERTHYDRLLKRAFDFSDRLFESVPADDLVVEGESKLFKHDDFQEVAELNEVLAALEEKQRILKLLDRAREAEGVKIFVGEETIPASIISAPYRKSGQIVGALGVIGPKHMNYSHIVPIVDFTAKLVSDYLEKH